MIETDKKLKIKHMQVISTINTTTVSIVLEKYAMTSVEKKQGKSTQKVTFEHRTEVVACGYYRKE